MATMKDTSKTIFRKLQDHYATGAVSKQTLANETGLSINTVTGSVRGLVSKGYAVEEIRSEPLDAEGKKMKDVRYVTLTDEGMAFDPDAEPAKPKAE